MKGITKNIKKAGRGETSHFKAMPDHIKTGIHKLLGIVLSVMKYRASGDMGLYKKYLNMLPAEYKDSYHELLLYGSEYTVVNFDLRRGQEGMEYLEKSHYELIEEDGAKYYKKVWKFWQNFHIVHYNFKYVFIRS